MIKLEIKGLQNAIRALKQFRAWTEDYEITPMDNGEIKIKKKGWLNTEIRKVQARIILCIFGGIFIALIIYLT